MIRTIQAMGESDDYYSWYYITPERVLEMVEQAGMLPPLNNIDDYLWEPEDE